MRLNVHMTYNLNNWIHNMFMYMHIWGHFSHGQGPVLDMIRNLPQVYDTLTVFGYKDSNDAEIATVIKSFWVLLSPLLFHVYDPFFIHDRDGDSPTVFNFHTAYCEVNFFYKICHVPDNIIPDTWHCLTISYEMGYTCVLLKSMSLVLTHSTL